MISTSMADANSPSLCLGSVGSSYCNNTSSGAPLLAPPLICSSSDLSGSFGAPSSGVCGGYASAMTGTETGDEQKCHQSSRRFYINEDVWSCPEPYNDRDFEA